jgi:hypothetical protein
MFRKIITAILLYGIAILGCGCYAVRPYPPQQVKPEWDVIEVVLLDSALVRFDSGGRVQNQMVVGGVRNEFDEVRTKKIPLEAVQELHVRRLHWDSTSLIAGGVGAGIAAFLVITILDQHRAKTSDGPLGIAN